MENGEKMRVDKSCEGCDYCEYNILDDYGCYDPGYYCMLDHCINVEYEEDEE